MFKRCIMDISKKEKFHISDSWIPFFVWFPNREIGSWFTNHESLIRTLKAELDKYIFLPQKYINCRKNNCNLYKQQLSNIFLYVFHLERLKFVRVHIFLMYNLQTWKLRTEKRNIAILLASVTSRFHENTFCNGGMHCWFDGGKQERFLVF